MAESRRGPAPPVLAVVVGLTLLAGVPAASGQTAAPDPDLVPLTLVGLNDVHGQLNPLTQGHGGLANLATVVDEIRSRRDNVLVVDGGDLTGETAPASARFGDEPTVEAMNLIGLDVHAAGNHEFDPGLDELLRLREGGCWQDDCDYRNGSPYPGADFTTLAANVFDEDTGDTVFPAWSLREVDGVRVGFVGVSAPSAFTEQGRQGLTWTSWAEGLNRATQLVTDAGAELVVALRHQGGRNASGDWNACPDDDGAIQRAVQQIDPRVDVVVDGHTHNAYVCDVADGPLVTQAAHRGAMATEIQLLVDPATGEVVERSATNHVVEASLPDDPDVAALIDRYDRWWERWTQPPTITRASGTDRVATAARLAHRFDEADTVLLARADHFADALVAGPYAGQEGAPLLLTDGQRLSPAAEAALVRLRPSRVVLVGGTGALAEGVMADVRSMPEVPDDAVERIAGTDRYDTAARIAARIRPDATREAFLTTGTNFPDALAGAALAAHLRAPVLLTDPRALPDATAAALRSARPSELVVLGGTSAVTGTVADAASRAAGVDHTRIAGGDRYETAANVAARFPEFATAFVATGQNFPDALAGVAAAAHDDAPVVLVQPDAVPSATLTQLRRVQQVAPPREVVIVGGESAVSADVATTIADALGAG